MSTKRPRGIGIVAAANGTVSRLIRFDETSVTFRYKDYRRAGADRQQVIPA